MASSLTLRLMLHNFKGHVMSNFSMIFAAVPVIAVAVRLYLVSRSTLMHTEFADYLAS
jgi:hypothetical protein